MYQHLFCSGHDELTNAMQQLPRALHRNNLNFTVAAVKHVVVNLGGQSATN
jgi:hypothetical protein